MTNWKLIFCCLYLISVMSTTFGLEVSMSQSSIEVARGDDVTLTCNFKPKNQDNKLIIISWTGDADETSGEQVLFGSFYSNPFSVDIGSQYKGKATIDTDLAAKISKLTLTQVTLKESRRIKCYVQIPDDSEGKPADSTFLLVQVAPSKPVCKVVGTPEYGHNISLTCVSEEGSPTPVYNWERYDVKNVQKPFPPKTTEKDGVLALVNVSMETSGYYICLSTNKVGFAKCNMTLSVVPPSMNLATIGIVAGCIAGAVVLIVIIICCCRKRKQKSKKTQVVEYHDKPELEYAEEGNICVNEERTVKARSDDNGGRPDDFRDNYDDRKGSRDDLTDRYDDRKGSRDDLRERYDDRKGSRDDLRDHYDDRKGSRDDLRDRYDDRKGSRDDLRDRYDDRKGSRDDLRERYDERKGSRDDLREKYDDRKGSRDDLRDRYDDRKGSRDDLRDRYDDRRGSRDDLRDHDDRRGSRDDLRDHDDRRGSRDDLRDRYDDRRNRYDDHRDRYR